MSEINFPSALAIMCNLKDLSVGSLFRFFLNKEAGFSSSVYRLDRFDSICAVAHCVGFTFDDGDFLPFMADDVDFFLYSDYSDSILPYEISLQ